MNARRWRSVGAALLICGLLPAVAPAAAVTVAAASNLQVVLTPLEQAFHVAHPDIELTFITAATGNLVAQIRHGAPFDVLLAADLRYPAALVADGTGVAATLRTFAQGQLVLWPAHGLTASTWAAALQAPALTRIALANPDTAPYGAAARVVLREAGVWDALSPKFVYGENIAQTLQFVTSGNAPIGFVTRSQVAALPAARRGQPDDVLPFPQLLPHGALLLRRAAGNAAATTFLEWLSQADAVAVFIDAGYAPPPDAPPPAANGAAGKTAAP